MNKLKNCYFCESDQVIVMQNGSVFFGSCLNCGERDSIGWIKPERAVENWNIREELPPSDLDKLKAINADLVAALKMCVDYVEDIPLCRIVVKEVLDKAKGAENE